MNARRDALRDLLATFAADEARASQATAPDPALEARQLGRQIARRRAVRAGAVASTSAAAVVGLAVGVYALTDREEPHPPATPTPTQSPTPTPTRTPTPSSTPTQTEEPEVALPPVTKHPLLPDAEPMPPGTLEAAGPGWVLVQRSLGRDIVNDGPVDRTYVYLVDPAGTRYEVPIVVDQGIRLVDWLPGSTTALVTLGGIVSNEGAAVLDLTTGELDVIPGVYSAVAFNADGDVVAVTADGVMVVDVDGEVLARRTVQYASYLDGLDPSRTWMLYSVYEGDLAALDARTLEPLSSPGLAAILAEHRCDTGNPMDERAAVVRCDAGEGRAAYWEVPLDGQARRLLTEPSSGETTAQFFRLDGRTYAALPRITDDDADEVLPARLVEVLGPDDVQPLPAAVVLVDAAPGVLVGRATLPDGEWGEVVVVDLATGETRPLLPPAPREVTAPDGTNSTFSDHVLGRSGG